MRLLPCGDVGVLVELADLDEVLALHAALEAAPPPGTVDLVPAARTVLVRLDPAQTSVAEVGRAVRATVPLAADRRSADELQVPVRYD